MELIFNELSIFPLSNNNFNANVKMKQFAKTVAEARKKGFRNIRSYYNVHEIQLADDYSVFHWLNNKDVQEVERNFLYGMIIQPFIKEDDEIIEDAYINANYFFEDQENLIDKKECIGLASAYLYETLSISLSSISLWDNDYLTILIEIEENSTTENVFNISSKESLSNNEISAFVESLGIINLIETDLIPVDKKIHLADHHGKAELQVLCNQLKLNPYVIQMRSTNWGGKNFIRKTYKDGVIEIVLTNSQKEYALWVQTTGTNLRETKAIADKLKERYS